jgi:rhodanese-related sulfurtransferase
MKKKICFSILFAAAVFLSCASDGDANNTTDYTDPDVIRNLTEDPPENFYLVDVRTPEEYWGGHIPGALNIPLSKIEEEQPTDNKDALIVVYCRSGNRSGQAKRILESLGYRNVHNFGGIIDWDGETVEGGKPREES